MTAYRLIPALALGALLATQADAEQIAKPTPRPAPVAIPGPVGPAGAPGINGRDADTRKVASYIAATGAMASLQTRTPTAGQWTGAFGLSGTDYGSDGVTAGVRYGLSDRADLYAVVGHSRFGGTVWGVGASWVIGGGK